MFLFLPGRASPTLCQRSGIRHFPRKFRQSILGAIQTIVVMITFRNFNKRSLQGRAGVYLSSTKRHPILRILQVLIFSRRLLLSLFFYGFVTPYILEKKFIDIGVTGCLQYDGKSVPFCQLWSFGNELCGWREGHNFITCFQSVQRMYTQNE